MANGETLKEESICYRPLHLELAVEEAKRMEKLEAFYRQIGTNTELKFLAFGDRNELHVLIC
jgi:hypothetical protein